MTSSPRFALRSQTDASPEARANGAIACRSAVLLHEPTVGAMRDLDRLTTAALRETSCKKRKLVERDVVVRVIEPDTRCTTV
jgi:hypothetical protein